MGHDRESRADERNTERLVAARVKRAVRKMTPALHEIYAGIGARLARADHRACLHKYRAGELVKKAMTDENSYGSNAVKLLATALGRDDDTLYDMARVASTWGPAEFAKLLARPTVHNVPLTFSHLVWLARAPEGKRAELTELALREGLGVRALRAIVRGGSAARGKGVDPGRRLLETHDRQTTRVALWLADVGRAYAVSAEGRKVIEAAIERQRELLALLEVAYARGVAPETTRSRRATRERAEEQSPRMPVAAVFGGSPP